MTAFLAHAGHEFWPDSVSLFDERKVSAARLLESAQITDSYLLALAVSKGGKLATFDKRLVTHGVVDGANALHIIQ